MFLAAADQTILASALPTIATSLHGICRLVVGRRGLPRRCNHRRAALRSPRAIILAGARCCWARWQYSQIASLGCALAPTLLLLIVARAVQGLGGGGLMTLSQALIGEHVAPRERGRYAGYFAMIFAMASTSGPVAGAYLTEHFSWRAIFLVNLPLGFIAALLALRVPQISSTHRRQVPARCRRSCAVRRLYGHAAFCPLVGWTSLRMVVVAAAIVAWRRAGWLRSSGLSGTSRGQSGDPHCPPQDSSDHAIGHGSHVLRVHLVFDHSLLAAIPAVGARCWNRPVRAAVVTDHAFNGGNFRHHRSARNQNGKRHPVSAARSGVGLRDVPDAGLRTGSPADNGDHDIHRGHRRGHRHGDAADAGQCPVRCRA